MNIIDDYLNTLNNKNNKLNELLFNSILRETLYYQISDPSLKQYIMMELTDEELHTLIFNKSNIIKENIFITTNTIDSRGIFGSILFEILLTYTINNNFILSEQYNMSSEQIEQLLKIAKKKLAQAGFAYQNSGTSDTGRSQKLHDEFKEAGTKFNRLKELLHQVKEKEKEKKSMDDWYRKWAEDLQRKKEEATKRYEEANRKYEESKRQKDGESKGTYEETQRQKDEEFNRKYEEAKRQREETFKRKQAEEAQAEEEFLRRRREAKRNNQNSTNQNSTNQNDRSSNFFINKLKNFADKGLGADWISKKFNLNQNTSRGIAIGGTIAITSLLIYASYKLYQRFFSDAAQKCNHLSYKEKTRCILNIQLKSLEKQIEDINRSRVICKNMKSKNICEKGLTIKLKKLLKRHNKIKSKLQGY